MFKIKTKKLNLLLAGIAIFIASISQTGAVELPGDVSNSAPARSFNLITNPTSPINASTVVSKVSQVNSCTPNLSCASGYTCQTITYNKQSGGSVVQETIRGCVHQGFSQPTFNKYFYNLNIPGARGTDEQKFLIAKKCPGGVCPTGCTDDCTPAQMYYNTLPFASGPGIQPGDHIRFQLYAHNNGKDGLASSTAENVNIGIEFSDNPDPNYGDNTILRPTGYIEANNAQYPRVSDDMQIVMDEFGMVLRPVQWAALENKAPGYTGTLSTNSSSSKQLGTKTVSITPHFNQTNEIWFNFDEFPGCFPYSSFVYFEAEAKRNTCENLDATQTAIGTKNGLPLYRLTKTALTFAETGTTKPSAIQFKWTTTDADGRFYPTQNSANGTNSIKTTNTNVYYTGGGTVSVKLVHVKPNGAEAAPVPAYLNQADCTKSFTFPATCENLSVSHTNSSSDNYLATIANNQVTVHKFTYNGLTFTPGTQLANLKLKWTVTGDSNGRFYTKSGANYVSAGGNTNTYTTANTTSPQTVYYVGTGTVSVKPVKSNGTDDPTLNVPACNKSFDVSNQDVTYCTGGISNTPIISQNVLVNGSTVYLHTLSPNAVPTYATGNIPFNVGLKWTTDHPATGKFYKRTITSIIPLQFDYVNQESSTVGALNTTVYYTGNTNDIVTAKLVKTNAAHTAEIAPTTTELLQLNQNVCKTTFAIPAEELTCSDLIVTQTPAGNIYTNSWTTFSAVAKNQHGNPFPGLIVYSVPAANGSFHFVLNDPGAGQASIAKLQGFNSYLHATTAGNNVVTATVSGTDTPVCTKTFSIIEEPAEPVCQDMTMVVEYETADGTQVIDPDDLLQSTPYEITATANYTIDPVNPENKFTPLKGLIMPHPIWLIPYITAGEISSEEATNPALNHPLFEASQQFLQPWDLPNGTPAYFFGFSDMEGPNAFRVEAIGYENPCNDSRGLVDLPAEPVCQNIKVYKDFPFSTELTTGTLLEKDAFYVLKSIGTYIPPLAEAQSTFETTQGMFISPIPQELSKTIPDNTYTILKTNADAIGTALTVHAFSNDPGNHCSISYDIASDNEPVCTNLETHIYQNNIEVFEPLEQNEVYSTTSHATYLNPPANPTITYTPQKVLLGPELALTTLKNAGGLSLVKTLGQFPGFQNPVILPENTPVYFLTLNDQTGSNSLDIEATGYEATCADDIEIMAQENPLECLSIQIFEVMENNQEVLLDPITPLDPGLHELKAYLSFEPETEGGEITFTTTEGILYKGLLPGNSQTQNAEEKESVFLLIPVNPTNTSNVLTVQITNSSLDEDDSCSEQFDLTEKEIEEKCDYIHVHPTSGTDLNPNGNTEYTLLNTSELGNFDGDFIFHSGCSEGEFGNTNDNDATFSTNEFKNGITYYGDNDCEDNDHSLTITADEDNTTCKAKYTYEEDDNPHGHTKKPTIEKWVMEPFRTEWKDQSDRLFYGTAGKYLTVTYRVLITTNGKSSINVTEEQTLRPTQNKYSAHTLELKRIAIIERDGNNLDLICNDGLDSIKNASITELLLSDILKKVSKTTKQNFSIKKSVPTCSQLRKKTGSALSGTNSDLTFKNLKDDDIDQIYIFYEYENNTNLTPTICSQMTAPDCGLDFVNHAKLPDYNKGDTTKLTILCPYVLTRESGDIFFHKELINVKSINSCAPTIDDTTGLILRPTNENTPQYKTGYTPGESTDSTWEAPTHDICKLSNTENEDLPEEYKNTLKNFSSSVCEMRADVAKQWKEKFINEAIKANVKKLTRWATSNTITTNPPVPENGIVYISGTDLTLTGFEIQGNPAQNIPAAHTYIVENGDLIINGNLTYKDNYLPALEMLINPKKIPSAAFIVIDGNIKISNNVTKLDGIFVAIDTTGDTDGEIQSYEEIIESLNTLTIRGSLVGDISNLFEYRRAIGTNPYQNEGSIVVKYDERILLNTPPGLTDLLNISQLRVAN